MKGWWVGASRRLSSDIPTSAGSCGSLTDTTCCVHSVTCRLRGRRAVCRRRLRLAREPDSPAQESAEVARKHGRVLTEQFGGHGHFIMARTPVPYDLAETCAGRRATPYIGKYPGPTV